ncbi:MAG: hypothetical protein JWR22_4327 [Herminiimonas sp.]|nr:hypothetical protein [Herminiimonas sp.]
MDSPPNSQDADVSAIKELMSKELSLSWGPDKDPNWDAFAGTFLQSAALFPAARPVRAQTLDHFIERMKRLQADGKLGTFNVTPLGCEVRVFGNVAVAFAACELQENESTTNREVNATVLVRENGMWRIAAQAWDVETDACKIPKHLAQRDDS